jgi:uncharacterized protein (TIGR00251 family)
MATRKGATAAGLTAADLLGLDITPTDGGVTLRVRVQPRGRRNELVGIQAGALKLRVAAPPVDGKANAAVTDYLAGVLGLGRGAVRIVSGATSRDKVVEVVGLTAAELVARLIPRST